MIKNNIIKVIGLKKSKHLIVFFTFRLGKGATDEEVHKFTVEFWSWPYLDCFQMDHPTLVKEVKVIRNQSKPLETIDTKV